MEVSMCISAPRLRQRGEGGHRRKWAGLGLLGSSGGRRLPWALLPSVGKEIRNRPERTPRAPVKA